MIYTVKQGDTLFRISQMTNVPVESIVSANGLNQADDLVIGQNLIIPMNPTTYTVATGDTMYSIARRFNINLRDLINSNPQISNPNVINVGDIINLPDVRPTIEVNGYALPSISNTTLEASLQNLTYLSPFSYQATITGELVPLQDERLLTAVSSSQTLSNMVVTNISQDGFDSDLASTILNNQNVRNTLINNIMSVVTAKNYNGVNIDFEYIYAQDRNNYTNFLRELKGELNKINIPLSVAVAPKDRELTGTLYAGHDYRAIGEIADRVIIMTYEWGYIYGEPQAISPKNLVEKVIAYATTLIPSQKILMGMPNYAYDWTLPYRPNTAATTLTNLQALELARRYGSNISFDTLAQAPYFEYYTTDGTRHIVWFDDARSIDSRLDLVTKYNLAGISIWTINNFNPVLWSVINNKFIVKKLK